MPFRFTGKIDKLTFKLGPSQLAAADQKQVRRRGQVEGLGSDKERHEKN